MLDDRDEFEPYFFSNEHLRKMHEKYSGREPRQEPVQPQPYKFENPHLQKLADKYAGR